MFLRNARGITDITGGERYLLTLLENFDRDLISPFILCSYDPKRGETAWLRELKESGHDYKLVAEPSLFSPASYTELLRIARDGRADFVHSIDHRGDVIGSLVSQRTGISAVASFFGWTNFAEGSFRGRVYPAIDRWALRKADAVIVDSLDMGQLVDQGPALTPMVRIPHGIDTQRFDPERYDRSLRDQLCATDAELLVGTVGRVHPNKGHLDFVEVAASVHSSHPKVHFVIIGDPPTGYEDYYDKLLGMIAQKGLEKNVRITNVPSARIPDAIGCMDMVFQASHVESFSIAALEAMAMARPLVATDVGGMSDMIVDQESGILVRPRATADAANALKGLIDDAARRSQIAKRARERILEHYTIGSMLRRTTDFYQRVFEWRQSPASQRDKRVLHAMLNG